MNRKIATSLLILFVVLAALLLAYTVRAQGCLGLGWDYCKDEPAGENYFYFLPVVNAEYGTPFCYNPAEPWQCQVLTPTVLPAQVEYPYIPPPTPEPYRSPTPRPTPTLAPTMKP